MTTTPGSQSPCSRWAPSPSRRSARSRSADESCHRRRPRVIARLAPSLLAALVVVDTFGGTDRTLSVDATAVGLLAAAGALAARLPMAAVIVIAAGVTAGLRALA